MTGFSVKFWGRPQLGRPQHWLDRGEKQLGRFEVYKNEKTRFGWRQSKAGLSLM